MEVKLTAWWFEGELVNGDAVEIAEWDSRGDGITTHEVSVLNNGMVARRVRPRDTLRGTVSDFKIDDIGSVSVPGYGRSSTVTYKIWKFRVQRHDVHGNNLIPGVVAMGGNWFSGDIKDGDEVEAGIAGDWQPGRELSTNQANLSTGMTVQAHTKGAPTK